MERVEIIEFHDPLRPRDLLWRARQMVVRGGPDGEVFLPVLYAGSHANPDDRIRLGRMTDWRGGEGRTGPRHGPTPVCRGRRRPRHPGTEKNQRDGPRFRK